MNEEIQFGLGLDTGGFFVGKRKVISMMDDLKSSIKSGVTDLQNSFKEAGRGIVAIFAADKLMQGAEKVTEFAEQIQRGAEVAGVSTDFFQTVGEAMRQTGGDAEKGSKGLEVLSSLIGQVKEGNSEAAAMFDRLGISVLDANGNAKDTEDVFRELADMVKNAGDANSAASIAVDVFGKKLGLELVPALRAGSDGLDNFGKSAEKLTEKDLKAITDFKHEMDSAGNTAMVWAGKTVTAIAKVGDRLGTLYQGGFKAYFNETFSEDAAEKFGNKTKPKSTGNEPPIKESKEYIAAIKALRDAQHEAQSAGKGNQGKYLELLEKEGDLQNDLNKFQGTEIDRIKLQTELQKAHNDVLNERKKIQDEFDKKQKDAADKKHQEQMKEMALQNEINQASLGVAKANDKLQDAKSRRYQLTISELANSRFRFGGDLGEDQSKARDITQLEKWAEWNRQHGFLDKAKNQLEQSDAIRSTLSNNVPESERFPYKDLQESSQEAANHLKEILEKAKGEGIKIIPQMD